MRSPLAVCLIRLPGRDIRTLHANPCDPTLLFIHAAPGSFTPRRLPHVGRMSDLRHRARNQYAVVIIFVVAHLCSSGATHAQELNATFCAGTHLATFPTSRLAAANWAGDTDSILYEAILPEERARIYEQTAGRLSRYRISAEVTPIAPGQPATISGTVEVQYVNETAAPQSEVFFRLYPNAPAYNEAAMTVSRVAVAGAPVTPTRSVDDTVLGLALPEDLAPRQSVNLELAYSAIVPVRPTQTYGIFAVDSETGTIALAHWFPLLAGQDQFGWSLDPVSRNGDPIFSNTALFDVRLVTPAGWEVAATGIELEQATSAGKTDRRFVSGPVRDFTVVTSDQFAKVSQEVGGTTVTSYFHPARTSGGDAVLRYGSSALAIFSRLLIPYPYVEMDLVEVELHGAGGVEFPQLMFMARALYDDGRARNEHYLEFVTAHEVGHQWFYAVVGNNQHFDAFIDEGVVEFLSTQIYFAEAYDAETARRQYGLEVLLWYLGVLQAGSDAIVDQPTDDFPNSSIYAAAVYAKAAIGFAEIHRLIGNDAFLAALRAYATAYEFGVGCSPALLHAFESVSHRDVAAVWREWFERANGGTVFTDEDYQELLVELGLR